MMAKEKYNVIGLMSGTSLDGLDLVYSTFKKVEEGWKFDILRSFTVQYSKSWKAKLSHAHLLSGESLITLDMAYGKYLGLMVNAFLIKFNIKNVDFVSSHGHTIFHQPGKGFTLQIGNGQALHAVTGLPVIYDFRTLDVLLGGEGAPLVPVGDRHLFGEFDICLNFGGIANLSLEEKKERIAYDLCFVNLGLNYLAEKAGKAFDKNGKMASRGNIHESLLKSLNKYNTKLSQSHPALGREQFERDIKPLLDQEDIPLSDRMRTFVESIAACIGQTLVRKAGKKKILVLCTGGGVHHSFLMYRLMEYVKDQVILILPDEDIVKFKEALIFGFLGVLRSRGEINCIKSATRARQDSSSGLMTGF